MLGPFHTEMAFFKALEKLVDSSGGPEMMINTDGGKCHSWMLKRLSRKRTLESYQNLEPGLSSLLDHHGVAWL